MYNLRSNAERKLVYNPAIKLSIIINHKYKFGRRNVLVMEVRK